jgi:hypothetical protein
MTVRPRILLACNDNVRNNYLAPADISRLENFAELIGTGSPVKGEASTAPTMTLPQLNSFALGWRTSMG